MIFEVPESDKHIFIGVDEVGYGSISGPLVVCGVKAPKYWTLEGLNDSKKLSAKKRLIIRDKLFELINRNEISYYLAERDNKHIDKYGVSVSLKDSYIEVFNALNRNDSLIICDGIMKFRSYETLALIKADTKIATVMAASIIAKTYRDSKMKEYHKIYPNYYWNSNMGYPTSNHIEAIRQYGFSDLHRKSYNISLA